MTPEEAAEQIINKRCVSSERAKKEFSLINMEVQCFHKAVMEGITWGRENPEWIREHTYPKNKPFLLLGDVGLGEFVIQTSFDGVSFTDPEYGDTWTIGDFKGWLPLPPEEKNETSRKDGS